jgi:hypothetical protein
MLQMLDTQFGRIAGRVQRITQKHQTRNLLLKRLFFL